MQVGELLPIVLVFIVLIAAIYALQHNLSHRPTKNHAAIDPEFSSQRTAAVDPDEAPMSPEPATPAQRVVVDHPVKPPVAPQSTPASESNVVIIPPISHEPLLKRVEEVSARLEPTFAAIQAVPSRLRDYTAMRAEGMAAEYDLEEIRSNIRRANMGSYRVLFDTLERIDLNLTRLQNSAQMLVEDYARLSELTYQLRREAAVLQADLAELENQPSYPVVWNAAGGISQTALVLVARLPERTPATSHNDLRRQLNQVRGLLQDVAQGQQTVD